MPFEIRTNHYILITIQTMMLHVDVAWAVFFLFKFDCIMSTFEAKTELTDFSFVKLC